VVGWQREKYCLLREWRAWDRALREGFWGISVRGRTPQGGLRGFPRGLTADGQGLIIGVDGREGWAQPYQVVIWEIPVYMLGMETLDFQPQYGCLKYLLRGKQAQSKTFRVYLDKDLRELVNSTAECAKQIVDGQQETRPDSPRKCQRCEYSEKCKWKF
jgi:hypothetical protein